MSRKKMRSQLDAIDQINVTPLLDLTFMLLIVFMITTPLMENGIDVTPPTMNADKIDTEKVVARLGGRRTCSCGETYHVSTHPSMICDKCGKELYIRQDDNEETIRNRMAVYEKTTAPLVDYYREKGLIVDVDANGTIEKTFQEIIELVK